MKKNVNESVHVALKSIVNNFLVWVGASEPSNGGHLLLGVLESFACLLINTLIRWLFIAAVLKNLHLIDGLHDDTSNVTLKATSVTAYESGIYNVKSELMRLLANLVYRHTANQHMVLFNYSLILLIQLLCIFAGHFLFGLWLKHALFSHLNVHCRDFFSIVVKLVLLLLCAAW